MRLYRYVENRAEIIRSLREREFEEMEAFCAESLRRAESGDALAQARAMLERFVQISHEHPMLYQLAWRRDPSLRADPQNVTTIVEHLSRLIQLCIERGQCINGDPRLAATVAFGMVNGTLMLCHSAPALGQTDQAELEREVIEAAMAYLTQQTTGR
jgi:AcrR family transcriptional regulator